jgi:O-methyltransferase involved in polyketide biosynthesis
MALPNALTRRLGAPSLDGVLLARHRIIDALLEEKIESGVGQVIEAACGMSPRGWRFSERYGEMLTYIEADLPPMAQRKREALAAMDSLDEHHRVADLDILRAAGPESLEALVEQMDPTKGLVIITEGLLTYFDNGTVEALWDRLARMLQPFATGAYLADLRVGSPGATERAGALLLSAFVRGRVHAYPGDEASAEAALHAAGFSHATLHRCDEHPAAAEVTESASAGMLSIVEARA